LGETWTGEKSVKVELLFRNGRRATEDGALGLGFRVKIGVLIILPVGFLSESYVTLTGLAIDRSKKGRSLFSLMFVSREVKAK